MGAVEGELHGWVQAWTEVEDLSEVVFCDGV